MAAEVAQSAVLKIAQTGFAGALAQASDPESGSGEGGAASGGGGTAPNPLQQESEATSDSSGVSGPPPIPVTGNLSRPFTVPVPVPPEEVFIDDNGNPVNSFRIAAYSQNLLELLEREVYLTTEDAYAVLRLTLPVFSIDDALVIKISSLLNGSVVPRVIVGENDHRLVAIYEPRDDILSLGYYSGEGENATFVTLSTIQFSAPTSATEPTDSSAPAAATGGSTTQMESTATASVASASAKAAETGGIASSGATASSDSKASSSTTAQADSAAASSTSSSTTSSADASPSAAGEQASSGASDSSGTSSGGDGVPVEELDAVVEQIKVMQGGVGEISIYSGPMNEEADPQIDPRRIYNYLQNAVTMPNGSTAGRIILSASPKYYIIHTVDGPFFMRTGMQNENQPLEDSKYLDYSVKLRAGATPPSFQVSLFQDFGGERQKVGSFLVEQGQVSFGYEAPDYQIYNPDQDPDENQNVNWPAVEPQLRLTALNRPFLTFRSLGWQLVQLDLTPVEEDLSTYVSADVAEDAEEAGSDSGTETVVAQAAGSASSAASGQPKAANTATDTNTSTSSTAQASSVTASSATSSANASLSAAGEQAGSGADASSGTSSGQQSQSAQSGGNEGGTSADTANTNTSTPTTSTAQASSPATASSASNASSAAGTGGVLSLAASALSVLNQASQSSTPQYVSITPSGLTPPGPMPGEMNLNLIPIGNPQPPPPENGGTNGSNSRDVVVTDPITVPPGNPGTGNGGVSGINEILVGIAEGYERHEHEVTSQFNSISSMSMITYQVVNAPPGVTIEQRNGRVFLVIAPGLAADTYTFQIRASYMDIPGQLSQLDLRVTLTVSRGGETASEPRLPATPGTTANRGDLGNSQPVTLSFNAMPGDSINLRESITAIDENGSGWLEPVYSADLQDGITLVRDNNNHIVGIDVGGQVPPGTYDVPLTLIYRDPTAVGGYGQESYLIRLTVLPLPPSNGGPPGTGNPPAEPNPDGAQEPGTADGANNNSVNLSPPAGWQAIRVAQRTIDVSVEQDGPRYVVIDATADATEALFAEVYSYLGTRFSGALNVEFVLSAAGDLDHLEAKIVECVPSRSPLKCLRIDWIGEPNKTITATVHIKLTWEWEGRTYTAAEQDIVVTATSAPPPQPQQPPSELLTSDRPPTGDTNPTGTTSSSSPQVTPEQLEAARRSFQQRIDGDPSGLSNIISERELDLRARDYTGFGWRWRHAIDRTQLVTWLRTQQSAVQTLISDIEGNSTLQTNPRVKRNLLNSAEELWNTLYRLVEFVNHAENVTHDNEARRGRGIDPRIVWCPQPRTFNCPGRYNTVPLTPMGMGPSDPDTVVTALDVHPQVFNLSSLALGDVSNTPADVIPEPTSDVPAPEDEMPANPGDAQLAYLPPAEVVPGNPGNPGAPTDVMSQELDLPQGRPPMLLANADLGVPGDVTDVGDSNAAVLAAAIAAPADTMPVNLVDVFSPFPDVIPGQPNQAEPLSEDETEAAVPPSGSLFDVVLEALQDALASLLGTPADTIKEPLEPASEEIDSQPAVIPPAPVQAVPVADIKPPAAAPPPAVAPAAPPPVAAAPAPAPTSNELTHFIRSDSTSSSPTTSAVSSNLDTAARGDGRVVAMATSGGSRGAQDRGQDRGTSSSDTPDNAPRWQPSSSNSGNQQQLARLVSGSGETTVPSAVTQRTETGTPALTALSPQQKLREFFTAVTQALSPSQQTPQPQTLAEIFSIFNTTADSQQVASGQQTAAPQRGSSTPQGNVRRPAPPTSSVQRRTLARTRQLQGSGLTGITGWVTALLDRLRDNA